MAVWRGAGAVGEMRGSVGGATYGNWKGRNIIKQRQPPVGRWHGDQPKIRSIGGWVSRQWAGISANKAFWNEFAASHPIPDKFGQPGLISGFNWFWSINVNNMLAFGLTALSNEAPPVAEPTITVESISIADGVTDGVITVTPVILGTPADTDKIQYQIAGGFTSPGRVEVESAFTNMSNADGDAASISITGLQVLAYYWVRARYLVANNRPSSWVYAQHQAPDVA